MPEGQCLPELAGSLAASHKRPSCWLSPVPLCQGQLGQRAQRQLGQLRQLWQLRRLGQLGQLGQGQLGQGQLGPGPTWREKMEAVLNGGAPATVLARMTGTKEAKGTLTVCQPAGWVSKLAV